jgi:hypothetical protein
VVGQLAGWRIGWLVDRLAGWVADWQGGLLAGWMAVCLARRLAGRVADWRVGWLASWLVDWPGWLAGWAVCWQRCLLAGWQDWRRVGWLAALLGGCPADWLAGWLGDWLDDCLVVRQSGWLVAGGLAKWGLVVEVRGPRLLRTSADRGPRKSKWGQTADRACRGRPRTADRAPCGPGPRLT